MNRWHRSGVRPDVRTNRPDRPNSRSTVGQGADDPSPSPDDQLLTELYRCHGRVLFAFCLRLVDDRSKAEDAVQETMLRAWRSLDKIDPRKGDPRSYLLSVARNVVIDTWRAEQRRPRLVSDDKAVAAQPVEDRLEARLDGWLVQQALERLSPDHLAVVEALYYRGATVSETAQVLGIPAGTVKSRAYYAVRGLRTAFEEMGVARSALTTTGSGSYWAPTYWGPGRRRPRPARQPPVDLRIMPRRAGHLRRASGAVTPRGPVRPDARDRDQRRRPGPSSRLGQGCADAAPTVGRARSSGSRGRAGPRSHHHDARLSAGGWQSRHRVGRRRR